MLPKQLILLCFAVATARAQNNNDNNDESSSTTSTTTTRRNNDNNNDGGAPAVLTFSQSLVTLTSVPASFTDATYETDTRQITVSTNTGASNGTATSTEPNTGSSTGSQSRRTSTSQELTIIGAATQTSSGTASTTSSSVQPSNTLPCNGYPELCNRKYSNVTHVAAHNSAFSIRNNAASNQYFDTETQLNDGIRMIQGQTHWVNDTVYMCHSSCDLLNAGPWQNQLEIVKNWVERHPYDVVTILVGNSDFVAVENYVSAVENSGIKPYLYEPEFIPQHRDQWPTLAEMIISGKRVVLFMDYMANQPKVPYILNEFTHIWETPFSPTDPAFPCTIGRPPDLNETVADEQWMYLANHNLNTAVSLGALGGGGGGGEPLLIPNTAEINNTNGQFNERGQLERTRLDCDDKWSHAPNFLLVDYYNYGDPGPGSVFEVAARANGVQYNRNCCGAKQSGAAGLMDSIRSGGGLVVLLAAAIIAVLMA